MTESELYKNREPTWAELKSIIFATSDHLKETERFIMETNAQLKQSIDEIAKRDEKRIQELDNLFSTQWRKLIESLSTPAAVKLFKDLRIGINRIYSGERKIKENGIDKIDLDIILCNSTVAVIVEVKTTFRRSDVDYFLEKMKLVKKYFPEFADKTIFVASAAIKYAEGSDKYAKDNGLFVIHTSGDGVFSMEKPKERKVF